MSKFSATNIQLFNYFLYICKVFVLHYANTMKLSISLILALLVTAVGVAQPKIVAHRGYHQKDGAARNSIESFKMAQHEGFEYIEIDVNLSSDGVPMVVHGPWHPNKRDGVHVQKSTKAQIQEYLLSNHEIVPTFEEMLKQVAKYQTTGLVIDIKAHNTPAIQKELIRKVATLVSRYKLQDKVLYMVNIEQSVYQLKRLNKRADNILFSNGAYSIAWRVGLGCIYIGYNHTAWAKKPELLEECALHSGVKTIAWTPNKESDIRRVVELGIDIIFSDNPMLVRKVINENH